MADTHELRPKKRPKNSEDSLPEWEDIVTREMLPELGNHRSLLLPTAQHPYWEKPQARIPRFIEYARYFPRLYKKMLGHLALGCSIITACNLMGVVHPTFRRWIVQGKVDLANEEDTYYSRFFQDVWWALSICAANCEMRVTRREPKEWLTRGMGKSLFEGSGIWQGKEVIPNDEERELGDLEPIPETLLEGGDSDESPTLPTLNEASAIEALEVLREQGILNIDDEYLAEARKKYLPPT